MFTSSLRGLGLLINLPEVNSITIKQPIGQNHRKKYLETNESKSIVCQNLWDMMKVTLGGKYITADTYNEEKEKFQMII